MPLTHQSIEVSPQDAHALATGGEGVVVDVREPWEWQSGHAAGAVHIPLHGLPLRHVDLPRERTVLCICASGHRSLAAADFLRGLGYDARSVAGGTALWSLHQLPMEA
jgi:rhodanese-related sulfurtransferase